METGVQNHTHFINSYKYCNEHRQVLQQNGNGCRFPPGNDWFPPIVLLAAVLYN